MQVGIDLKPNLCFLAYDVISNKLQLGYFVYCMYFIVIYNNVSKIIVYGGNVQCLPFLFYMFPLPLS